jgi:hypothetical protein
LDGTPQYKITSSPHATTVGFTLSGNYSVSFSQSSGDTAYNQLSFNEVYDTNLNGSISQNISWTFGFLISGRSLTVVTSEAIIYSGVADSLSQSFPVNT